MIYSEEKYSTRSSHSAVSIGKGITYFQMELQNLGSTGYLYFNITTRKMVP
jgi:hypothetical protein